MIVNNRKPKECYELNNYIMEHQPFSVAMSVYKNDSPVYFDRALESITDQQTIKPDEIVLVVDGPVPEETNGIIEKYSKNIT